MARSRNIRIYGKQRKELDADLMVQILIMLGHELEEREKNNRDTGDARPAGSSEQAEEDWS